MSQLPIPPSVPPSSTAGAATSDAQAEELLKKMRNGAGWLYFIAGLSLVNTLLVVFNADRHFGVGMAFTLFVDALAGEILKENPDQVTIVRTIELIIDTFAITACAATGFFCMRGHRWAFIVALALYGLDTLLSLLFMRDGMVVLGIIHVVALVYIGMGFAACLKIHKLAHQRALVSVGNDPTQPAIGG